MSDLDDKLAGSTESEPPSPETVAAKQEAADAAVLRESRKHTRRSFVVAAAGAERGTCAGTGGADTGFCRADGDASARNAVR